MKIASILFILLLILSSEKCADAQKKGKTNSPKSDSQESVLIEAPKQAVALKVLATDEQSDAEEPFVFVARDAQTYANLQKLTQNLPAANSINFKTTAVVAAFAGTKPTPGYEIVFSQNAAGLKIDLTAPAKDAILAQVLTAPAKIVAVPLLEDKSLTLELARNWQTKASIYRVTSGEFEQSGGIAGKIKKINVTGTVNIFRLNDLATAIFNLNGVNNADQNKKMFAVASGTIVNNQISFARIEPGTLIETPHPALTANGTLAGNSLSLTFTTVAPTIADGFSGSGKIVASR